MSEHDEALRKRLEKMVLDHARLHGDGPYAPKSSAAWCDAVESVALDLLAKLDTVEAREPKWIPCSERMPEMGEMVVCFRPQAQESVDQQFAVDTYTGRIHKSPQGVEHGFDRWCHPSHWMPLPAPPTDSTPTQDTEVG